jgi:hypothetical protein
MGMRVRWDERTLFHSYIYAVTVLFVLYIVPVTLKDIAGALYHYFFLIGVPVVSLLLGALSMGVLGWRAAPEGPKELPQYIGYLMLFVTLLSIIIWIVDMSFY